MAVIHPRVHWGRRDVDWTWVPARTTEMVDLARRLFSETLGMAAFTFLAGSAIVMDNLTNGGLGILGMAAATGLAYALIVYSFQPASGGHINPAVTIGQVMGRRMPPSIGLLYLGAQAGGAVLGALFLELIYNDFFAGEVSNVAALSFNANMTEWVGGVLEAILTFLLVTVYFRAFVDPRGDAGMGAVGMGLVVGFSFLVAFPITGAALNVSRVFGTDLVAGEWTDFFWYWIGLAGGAVAGVVYEYLFMTREEET